MWDSCGPYTPDEVREMRRLIVASGIAVSAWAERTRRSAEFVRSLSPEQAEVITLQALAVTAEPDELGEPAEVAEANALFALIEPEQRQRHLWQLLVAIRHRHYPPQD